MRKYEVDVEVDGMRGMQTFYLSAENDDDLRNNVLPKYVRSLGYSTYKLWLIEDA